MPRERARQNQTQPNEELISLDINDEEVAFDEAAAANRGINFVQSPVFKHVLFKVRP